MGRPREFDIDDAVATASDLFWRNGYDRTSLADLTNAMGITPPSFYFAFGSKEGLFGKVLNHYLTGHLSYFEEALREPTARRVVERLLYGYADGQTDPAHPPGCLGVNCALPCPEDADAVRQMLAAIRKKTHDELRKRFAKAKADGDLAADADPGALARFVQTIGWGMAVDAQSGATRKDLHRTVAIALEALPPKSAG